MSCSFELLLLLASLVVTSIHGEEFLFSQHLKLDGANEIMPNGSAMPYNAFGLRDGQIFYAQPFKFKPSQTSNINGFLSSFSTSFVLSINLESPTQPNHPEGFSFVISPAKWLALNNTFQENQTEGSLSLIMINFKISRNSRGFEDNHLEININGVPVLKHSPLGYYRQSSDEVRKARLTMGQFAQVWLEYDGNKKEISGSVAPVSLKRDKRHSFSYNLNIAPYVCENMFVGISKSNSGLTKSLSSNYYLLGWSMKMNGKAQEFDPEKIFEFTPKFGSQIPQIKMKGFHSGFPSDFSCLGCLEKFLLMMNCTSEQIEVLEGQCRSTVYHNVNDTKSLA